MGRKDALGSRQNFKAKVYSRSGKEGGKADSFQEEGVETEGRGD